LLNHLVGTETRPLSPSTRITIPKFTTHENTRKPSKKLQRL